MSEREELDRAKEYALSNFDIQELLEPNTKIFRYPELNDARHIDEMLDRHGRAIMLFLTDSENKGHWIALIRRGSNIEIFDPYGNHPHKFGKELGGSMNDMKEWGQDPTLLTDLIKKSGYGVVWNNKQVQPLSKDTNTCGRHSVLRLLFHKYPLKEYQGILKKIQKETGVSPDDLATFLTAEWLGK